MTHMLVNCNEFELEGLEDLVGEGISALVVGLRPDVDRAQGRLRLEPCGHVHAVAEHVELADHRAPDVTRDEGARVDAAVDVEGDLEAGGPETTRLISTTHRSFRSRASR